MPTITKTFTYTGTTQVLTIPPGTTSMDVHLWGGAGGGGGGDQGGPGRVGASGGYVTATSIDMTSHIGKILKVAVGGGGAAAAGLGGLREREGEGAEAGGGAGFDALGGGAARA